MRNFLYNKSDILIAVIIIVVAAIIIWTRVDAIMGPDKTDGEPSNVSSGEELPPPDTGPTDGAITEEPPVGDEAAGAEQPPAEGDGTEAPPEDEGSLDEEPVEFTVEVGSAASRVADDLESMGLVESADVFLAELTAQNAETKLKAGTFEIAPGTSVADIVKKLTN
jgi:hypothetical protein